jgi:hypothetical protein
MKPVAERLIWLFRKGLKLSEVLEAHSLDGTGWRLLKFGLISGQNRHRILQRVHVELILRALV